MCDALVFLLTCPCFNRPCQRHVGARSGSIEGSKRKQTKKLQHLRSDTLSTPVDGSLPCRSEFTSVVHQPMPRSLLPASCGRKDWQHQGDRTVPEAVHFCQKIKSTRRFTKFNHSGINAVIHDESAHTARSCVSCSSQTNRKEHVEARTASNVLHQLGHQLMSVGRGRRKYCSVSAKRNWKKMNGHVREQHQTTDGQIQLSVRQSRRQLLVPRYLQTNKCVQQSAQQHKRTWRSLHLLKPSALLYT